MGLFLLSLLISLGLLTLALALGLALALHVQYEILGGVRELLRLLYPLVHW